MESLASSEIGNPEGNIANKAKEEAKKIYGKTVNTLKNESEAHPHQKEGTITKKIEAVTTKIPSSTFLALAVGAIGGSLLFQLAGRKEDAQFVGHWVPTILLLGLYNKVVKLHGSE